MLVSHDRAFLDNVVTSTLVLEGGGRIGEYVGGYSDWVRQRTRETPPPVAKRAAVTIAPQPAKEKRKRRLTPPEVKELAALPGRIEGVERERERLYASLGTPELLRDGAAVVAARARLIDIDGELGALLARWEELATIEAEAG